MNAANTIPVLVGVTAHRKIREEDRAAIYGAVKAELQKLQAVCPHSRIVMLTSLAEGGDLLCAEAAEELNIPLIAALPRAREDYENDFSDAAKAQFSHCCGRAEQVLVTPPVEAVPEDGGGRDFQFRQAGIYVAAHSHVLLALWDGGPGTEAACGTAEAVDFALHGSYAPVSGIPLRSGVNEAVIHIFTPRGDRVGEVAGNVHYLGDCEAVLDILRKTDDFNQNAGDVSPGSASRLPAGAEEDPGLKRKEILSRTAGELSRQYAQRYRLVLAMLAAASTLLTFSFLMYDEAQAVWMILVCGLMLVIAWSCQRYAVRSDCHRRYIEYRALAECLRVQTYLRYAGSLVQTADLLPWTQQEETAWIMDALCALSVEETPAKTREIRSCWVDAQRDYHLKAAKTARLRLTASERTVRAALLLSMILYLGALGFELFCGGLTPTPRFPAVDVEHTRTLLKILLGTISAVTLFISGYYGRLSLPRTLSDHEKMARFYGRMSAQLGWHGQTEELLTVLARTELVENGDWCSYQRDNKPNISL